MTTNVLSKVGYPSIFPLAIGAWQLTISALMYADGGKHALLASRLLSVFTGGIAWHHVVGEKDPSHVAGGLLFWLISVYIPYARKQASALESAGFAATLALVGWAIGAFLPKTPTKEKK